MNQFTTLKDGLNINVTSASPGLQNLGDVTVNSTSSNLAYYNGSTASDIATASNTLALTNKSLDASVNTLTNITNSAISATAAIAYSKLNLTSSIQSTDFASTSGSGAVVLANSPTLVTPALGTPSALVGTNITGTAAGLTAGNINATTNSTITTLPNLSLPASQFTGILSTTNGGTGQNLSSSTGVLQITAGSVSASTVSLISQVSGVLPVANGGTASSTSTQAFQTLAPSASVPGQNITWNGTSWGTATPSAGTKNYLTALTTSNGTNTGNGNFEFGNTTGWSLGTVGSLTNGIPTGTPTFGSGAAGTLSFSATTSSPLSGTYSGSLVSTGATTQGNMLASSSFFIDNEDQAKVLTFKQYFSVPSGAANCNFSGTSSNSFAIAVYDVTNSTFLSSTSNFGMTQSSGIGYVTGTCQTNSNTTQLRYVLYCANATTGAVTLNVDDIFVGPQTSPLGAVMTDWQSYALTVGGSTSAPTVGTNTNRALWRRVGDSVEILYYLSNTTGGSAGSGTYLFPLPSGLFADTTKSTMTTSQTGSSGTVVGYGTYSNTTSAATQVSTPTEVFLFNTSNLYMVAGSGTSAYEQAAIGSTNGQLSGGANYYTFNAKVPVMGWSSNVQMSSDTDTRLVTTTYGLTTAQAVSANAVLKYDTLLIDKTASYSTSTGLYTVPVTGSYVVSIQAESSSTYDMYIKINGTPKGYILGAPSGGQVYSGSITVAVNAGDTLGIYADASVTFGGPSTNGYLNQVTFTRLSGPSVVAATESVNGRYFGATATITSSDSIVSYSTRSFDTHNAYSSGTLTIPVSGKYQLNANLETTASFTIGLQYALSIYKNGVQVTQGLTFAGGTQSFEACQIADVINCLAGDVVTIQVSTNASGASVQSSTVRNYFSWSRVGN